MATSKDIISIARARMINLDELEAALDEASHAQRLKAIRGFNTGIQKRLFEQTVDRKAVTIDQIVPPEVGPVQEVIHWGQNTLPIYQKFQKRFCRPSPDYAERHEGKLWGYNHQLFKPLTGPGYFVAYDDTERGEAVIDYRQLPPDRPQSWPEIIMNKEKLGLLVYHGMVDRLRFVSDHVTIGRAYKKGDKAIPSWFVLLRQDP